VSVQARWALIALVVVCFGSHWLIRSAERRAYLASAGEHILTLQRDLSPQARAEAAFNLGRGRWEDEHAVSALAKSLTEDPDSRVREACAHALHRLGKRAASAVPALCEAENDGNRDVRKAANSALASIRDALRETR